MDNLSKQQAEERDLALTVLSQLDGSVQSQGVPISFNAWLNMGSDEWKATDERTKAYAYQAAMATGWTDEGIKSLLKITCPHILPSLMNYTFECLQLYANTYPVEIVKEDHD